MLGLTTIKSYKAEIPNLFKAFFKDYTANTTTTTKMYISGKCVKEK